jgi:hypothetical protein
MDISKDQEERARFMSRRKFETDLTSNLLTAEARGEARGIEIGMEKVIALIEQGFSAAEIKAILAKRRVAGDDGTGS